MIRPTIRTHPLVLYFDRLHHPPLARFAHRPSRIAFMRSARLTTGLSDTRCALGQEIVLLIVLEPKSGLLRGSGAGEDALVVALWAAALSPMEAPSAVWWAGLASAVWRRFRESMLPSVMSSSPEH